MLFNLVKKDFIISKKYVYFMLFAAAAMPPYIYLRMPEYKGTPGFILSAVFTVLMLIQNVSLKEYQYPKAAMLLCTAPFPRKIIVLSKYIFCIAVYTFCCIVFAIETLFIPAFGGLDIKLLLIMFFVISVFIGIYLPIQYKFGYEKTRLAILGIIMFSPVITPVMLKTAKTTPVVIPYIPPLLIYSTLFLSSIIILLISAYISVYFYKKTDIA